MAQPELRRLLPDAPKGLCDILGGTLGPVEPPIRSEVFGPQRFAQHAHSLALTHRASSTSSTATTFFPRLKDNIFVLNQAHNYIGQQASTGYDISPAAEWLLDNFHLIEAQLKEIHEGLPRSYFHGLPVLVSEPLAGLPRVYGVAWAFVAHTDGAFDEDLLSNFLIAYQETTELNLSEMWALPTTLRVVLIENLRRLAQRVAANKAAREVANLCCDNLSICSVKTLQEMYKLLSSRGVGRMFLAQMAQRLLDTQATHLNPYRDWVRAELPDLATFQMQLPADQAADNVSMRNAITSLRAIGDADWPDIVARTSALMRAMLTTSIFEAEDGVTRDQSLHDIELLAKRSGKTELSVAQALLRKIQTSSSADDAGRIANYWLRGAGRPGLMQALEIQDSSGYIWKLNLKRTAVPAYLASLLLGTVGIVGWLIQYPWNAQASIHTSAWIIAIGLCAMVFPASEVVLAVINRLISESTRPSHLPRLAFADGVPPQHKVIVVIPAMLSSNATIKDLAHHMLLHYLANPERNAQFAMLTDWSDADTEMQPADSDLLKSAEDQVKQLNLRYPQEIGDTPRFIILHRKRSFSKTEMRWIGWERKRGKLELLVITIAEGLNTHFFDLGESSRIAANIKYIVTLDSDTQLPPGRLRELVGVAAHPENQPKLDISGRRVLSGYGILQPRVATPLPSPREFTLYHWLFAGHSGIDPYSAATSETYQDLFGEGTFTGKGLMNVQAMYAVLSKRLPDGQVLSHDLLEGSLARCAAVTDITVIEEAPFHADVAASRVHRWTRGDWQLLPFMFRSRRYPLHTINRWKMLDNLRRSMVAPMSLLLLVLSLSGAFLSPWVTLLLVVSAFSVGPLMGAIAGLSPSRDDIAKRHFYRLASIDLVRAMLSGLWNVVQLVQQTIMALDAIGLALYRTTISRKYLLQWTTAATAQAAAKMRLSELAREHWKEPVLAMFIWAVLLAIGTPFSVASTLLCLLWAASPVWTWLVSRVQPNLQSSILAADDQSYLEGIARDTWRLFERCVGADDNHLPPDNLQITPHDMVAHRTSPTNIGLYLLSVACARQFGWISTQVLISRLQATYGTLKKLPRYRGHFYNWYDTQTLAPLQPMYVSTVDSGNLSGHLLAVAQACLELARAPHDASRAKRAIQTCKQRLEPIDGESALARLLAIQDPVTHCHQNTAQFEQLLFEATNTLDDIAKDPNKPILEDEQIWRLYDYLSTLRSMLSDFDVSGVKNPSAMQQDNQQLETLAHDFKKIAWQAEFNFLYSRKRRLLHIGYRVAEQQLDNGFYDLLASESRLTSLLAIAKGDIPVKHWAALGRPFYAVGAHAGLRSWSGSMFEYLMPSLVLNEPPGSVLDGACRAALREQIQFADSHKVPWGISECAYAASDQTLAYQYAPQGVPRLALRRTPPDELVIAPYATALAAQIAPQLAISNFERLQTIVGRARYGYVEALDYSVARQTTTESFTSVDTFMAHHQGMTIVAIANVLLDCAPRRWGMANASIQAVSSLLHERIPREVSILHAPTVGSPPQVLQKKPSGLLRDIVPGGLALEPTHLLSNGRYTVSLRANGAGNSRWGQTGITRWRDDALRDAYGSFFYVKWDRQPDPVSITQHPAPDSAAHYKSTFQADRVFFDTVWSELQAHVTVWVSPEDDIEFRRVELRNLSNRTLDIELISAFEITLADPKSDEAHPAFSNFFMRSHWSARQQALIFERRPRIATDSGVHAAHFLAITDPQVVSFRLQTNRQHWLGRNHAVSQPLGIFNALPSDETESFAKDGSALDVELDTGLDPVCAMQVRLRIAPFAKARLTFATTAAADAGTLHAVIDKYQQHSHVQRSSLMSATLAGIRLRTLGISAEKFAAVQSLTTALMMCLTQPESSDLSSMVVMGEICDKRLLWRFGISADRPIILVSASMVQGIGLLRSVVQAMRLWSWSGVICDVVWINSEPASYEMTLHREMLNLQERYRNETGGESGNTSASLFVLRSNELSVAELNTLEILARIRLNADGRPFSLHVQEWGMLHEQAFEHRHRISRSALVLAKRIYEKAAAPVGQFDSAAKEFKFNVNARLRPEKPWVNVIANSLFGVLFSETGGGYTWAGNSRLNQLTPWSNDPVADPPAEWFFIQNVKTQEAWSLAASAWGDGDITYNVTHGQGYSEITHTRGELHITARWCVDNTASTKQVQLKVVNQGQKTVVLRAVGIVEWMMGANRSDRSTVTTALFRQRLPDLKRTLLGCEGIHEQKLTALLCTQRERSGGFGEGTAFLAIVNAANESEDWTCDRREFFDSRGRLVLPDHFSQRSGNGLDPCAALSTRFELKAGESAQKVFLMGYAENVNAAQQLATVAVTVPAQQRVDQVKAHWDRLLGATTVKTPDPLFDAMVNRWLLYQTLSCRLWAKAGFYQAGGAYGFRDQLQDAMALTWAAPQLLRQQIVLNASRQFPEGDVQHWWHAPGGAGVRTHFSDDLLWLPHACVHYLRATDDTSLLDERVAFIDGPAIPDGAEDAYFVPSISHLDASVYEHAARAIDRSLRVGVHGLPLMGSGDWNDGMNRVGHQGRGESVWLAWFLCKLVADFAPLAIQRGDNIRALQWENASLGWKTALHDSAWDGQWFKRAFFDDASALGSSLNNEARIDLIAQAWSVLSDVAQPALQRIALEAIETHLVDSEKGLVKLLAPPFQHSNPSPGYIQAYPPGVRENGGQYSHGAVWALMAQAAHATSLIEPGEKVNIAYRYFTYLSPAHRAVHPTQSLVYGIEPYVMAGDVYSQAPYVGHGGWSWYTGAAAWMHRAAVESIFGLQLNANELSFKPCLPTHWPQAELTLLRDGRSMRFILSRSTQPYALATTQLLGAQLLQVGQKLKWRDLQGETCFVIPLL